MAKKRSGFYYSMLLFCSALAACNSNLETNSTQGMKLPNKNNLIEISESSYNFPNVKTASYSGKFQNILLEIEASERVRSLLRRANSNLNKVELRNRYDVPEVFIER